MAVKNNIPRSLTKVLEQIDQDYKEVRDTFLELMAEDITQASPVDTGAYVTSHSITTATNKGRSRQSNGKPQAQDPVQKKAEALEQLLSDIASLDDNQTRVYINNRSPHNRIVEYGSSSWRRQGYLIYNNTMARSASFLQEAIRKVRGSP